MFGEEIMGDKYQGTVRARTPALGGMLGPLQKGYVFWRIIRELNVYTRIETRNPKSLKCSRIFEFSTPVERRQTNANFVSHLRFSPLSELPPACF